MKKLLRWSVLMALLLTQLWAAGEDENSRAEVAAAIKPGESRKAVEAYLKEHHFRVTYLPNEARIDAILPKVARTATVSSALIVVVYFTDKDVVRKTDVRIERTGL